MNREIKFNFIFGIDGEPETYFNKTFSFAEIENGEVFEVLSDNPLYKNYSRLAKRQFTGLLDKHGKEIYEGDVIAAEGLYVPHFTVEWLESGFELFDNDDGFLSPDTFEWDWFEIIGNKFEHPELCT